MRILITLIAFSFCFCTFAQKPVFFISATGPLRKLAIRHLPPSPPYPRTRTVYQPPKRIWHSYRTAISHQVFLVSVSPHQENDSENFEAFGIPEEIEHDPVGILRLVPPLEDLVAFFLATSNPILSAQSTVPMMRNEAILALGALGNLYIEAAHAIREQNYEQQYVDEQLANAYRTLTAQINQLTLALETDANAAAILQIVIENRDSLGYNPPPPPPRGSILHRMGRMFGALFPPSR